MGLDDLIRTQVALGIDTFDEVVWRGVDYLADETGGDAADPEIVERVWRTSDGVFRAYLADQASWPEATDSDRLTAAFRDLDGAGIVAREVFTCCQNCGHAEIGDEFSPGRKPRGYVFYHEQDAERGVDGQGVYLAYDGFEQERIGTEVVAALQAHGLEPIWTGSSAQRILVPMTWRRRRIGRLAAHPGMIDKPDFTVRVEPLDGWAGPQPIAGGLASGLAWSALRLPWLPRGKSVRITSDERSVVIRREWDRLIGDDGSDVPASDDVVLEVSYDHRSGGSDGVIPMTLAESLTVLRALPVRTRSWATYASRSGQTVQHIWEDGPVLWMEHLDPAQSASHGRHVSVAEARQVIVALAEQDRVVLPELGDLVTRPW